MTSARRFLAIACLAGLAAGAAASACMDLTPVPARDAGECTDEAGNPCDDGGAACTDDAGNPCDDGGGACTDDAGTPCDGGGSNRAERCPTSYPMRRRLPRIVWRMAAAIQK